VSVRIGMEAGGHARWFKRLLAELGFELCRGDPAQIRKKRVRKQKTDRQDAQLLWHRHRMVQMRTRIMNQWQRNVAGL
jgi:transposase